MGEAWEGTISDCKAEVGVSGDLWVGGLLGGTGTGGAILDCHASCVVTGGTECGGLIGNIGAEGGSATGCSSAGSVTVTERSAGGLVGMNGGTIERCFSTANATGLSANEIGGLVGRNMRNILNSYAIGSVSGSYPTGGLAGLNWKTPSTTGNITNCYSTGASNGGGLIGYNINGVITGSFWDVNTSGKTSSDGGTGLNTAQMMQQASFTGWDFTTIWAICEGTNYPRLRWQIPLLGDFVCPDGVDMDDLAVLCEQWLLEELSSDAWPEGGDGIVNFFDWAIFAAGWQITVDFDDLADFADQWLKTGANYYIADIAPAPDGDGIVNMLDFAALANNWLAGVYN